MIVQAKELEQLLIVAEKKNIDATTEIISLQKQNKDMAAKSRDQALEIATLTSKLEIVTYDLKAKQVENDAIIKTLKGNNVFFCSRVPPLHF